MKFNFSHPPVFIQSERTANVDVSAGEIFIHHTCAETMMMEVL